MDRVAALLAAPFVGSFLGVLIRRLPAGRPVAVDRSACEQCGHALGAAELVPLVSFAALRGRCRHCAGAIDPFHWQVEVAALAVPLSALLAGLDGAALLATCAAGWLLLALAWIDAETMLLPDALTGALFLAGLAAAALLAPDLLPDRLAAGLSGFALLWAVAFVYRRVRGWDGLGGGDPRLLGAIGAWVGLAGLPAVLLGAALAGLAWALFLRLRGRALSATTALPFGPFLALAAWAVLLVPYAPA